MQPCNRIYYSTVHWGLNMFQAAYRSSSGALTVFAASGLHTHVVTGRSQVWVGTGYSITRLHLVGYFYWFSTSSINSQIKEIGLSSAEWLNNLFLLWCDMFFPSSHNFTLWCFPDEVQNIPSLWGCAKQVVIPWVLQVGISTHHQALTQPSTHTYLEGNKVSLS